MWDPRWLFCAHVLLAALACRAPAPHAAEAAAPESGPAVAELDGVTITAAELEERAGGQLVRLRQEEYEVRRAALEELIGERLLDKEARARGLSTQELLRREVEDKAAAPEAAEAEALYHTHRARFGDRPREAALAEIRAALSQRARSQRRAEYVRQLRDKSQVRIVLAPPRTPVQVPAGAPALGPERAPVTIVAFTDYQCPFCHRAQLTIDEVLSRYAGKVRLVHRDFPLDGHPRAVPAARAAYCAGEQGRFWEFYRDLMVVPGDMGESDLAARAARFGLDSAAFGACLASDRHDRTIRESFEQGTRLGVSGTPAFFINGRLVSGARPFETFREVIEDELARR